MRVLIAFVVTALAGCATWFAPLVPGTSREADVIAKFGTPESTHVLANGDRVLDYPREPEGMQNWRVVLTQDGTVRSVEQLVDEPTFARIQPGMTREQVLQALGRPTEEKSYALLAEDVVSWRYLEFGRRIMFFNAHFEPSGRLKYTSRSQDPITANDGSTNRR